MSSPSPRLPPALLGLVLAAAAALAYGHTLGVPFLLDDTVSIVENPTIRDLRNLGAVLSPPASSGFGGRPIANLSFALNHAVGGLAVRGYHVVNLAIHVAAAWLLAALVHRTLALLAGRGHVAADEGSARLIAGGAALLWLLHPLQTESVTYLSQRTEALMALFYLATLAAFLHGATSGRSRWLVLAVVSCALGMATKEVMVTAPVMVLLFDRTFVAGSFAAAWRLRHRWHLALAATWGLLLFLLLDVQERGVGTAAVSSWQYALTSCRTILTYLKLAAWPAPLVFDYGTAVAAGFGEVWPHVLALGALLGATAFALWRRPVAGFGAAWVLLLLAPATSFVPVAGQTMAEHRMYLPLAAPAVAVAWMAYRWLGRRSIFATAALAAVLGAATFDRNRDYRDARTLWTDTVAKAPANARAHAALGAALLAEGRLSAARTSLQRAVELDPRLAEAHNN
ncbi:MAG: hypothetical protein IT429_24940, partial [Gemmataceae bacterium]|nr:hypothetical protein [Gemmataceae bacterium]